MDTPTSQLRETDYLVAWLLYFVCTTVGGGLAGGVAGAILGGVLGASGATMETIKMVAGIAGFIVALPVSYFLFRFFVARFLVQKLMARQNVIQPPPLV